MQIGSSRHLEFVRELQELAVRYEDNTWFEETPLHGKA
jgi:hypothetical protein